MLNSIVDGISKKLNEVFGDDYKIYTEQVKQGLQEPCFFIQLIEPMNTQQLGNRYFRENLFCIQYFPINDNEPRAECSSVQDDIFLALEYITVNTDLWRGTKMHGELTDGILTFFVNYDSTIYKVIDTVEMDVLQSTNTEVKGA